jgi:uncharacterized protein YrrD
MAAIKEFRGKLLIGSTDGKKLGEVKDLYLDKSATKVTAVYLGKEGILNRKALLIDIGKIQLFGVDAWLVASSDTVKAKDEFDGAEEFLLTDDLRGREIQTDGGTRIAIVADALVDSSMNVLGFSFDKVYVEGPLAVNKAIARAAVFELGNSEKPMITVLEQAESLTLNAAK